MDNVLKKHSYKIKILKVLITLFSLGFLSSCMTFMDTCYEPSDFGEFVKKELCLFANRDMCPVSKDEKNNNKKADNYSDIAKGGWVPTGVTAYANRYLEIVVKGTISLCSQMEEMTDQKRLLNEGDENNDDAVFVPQKGLELESNQKTCSDYYPLGSGSENLSTSCQSIGNSNANVNFKYFNNKIFIRDAKALCLQNQVYFGIPQDKICINASISSNSMNYSIRILPSVNSDSGTCSFLEKNGMSYQVCKFIEGYNYGYKTTVKYVKNNHEDENTFPVKSSIEESKIAANIKATPSIICSNSEKSAETSYICQGLGVDNEECKKRMGLASSDNTIKNFQFLDCKESTGSTNYTSTKGFQTLKINGQSLNITQDDIDKRKSFSINIVGSWCNDKNICGSDITKNLSEGKGLVIKIGDKETNLSDCSVATINETTGAIEGSSNCCKDKDNCPKEDGKVLKSGSDAIRNPVYVDNPNCSKPENKDNMELCGCKVGSDYSKCPSDYQNSSIKRYNAILTSGSVSISKTELAEYAKEMSHKDKEALKDMDNINIKQATLTFTPNATGPVQVYIKDDNYDNNPDVPKTPTKEELEKTGDPRINSGYFVSAVEGSSTENLARCYFSKGKGVGDNTTLEAKIVNSDQENLSQVKEFKLTITPPTEVPENEGSDGEQGSVEDEEKETSETEVSTIVNNTVFKNERLNLPFEKGEVYVRINETAAMLPEGEKVTLDDNDGYYSIGIKSSDPISATTSLTDKIITPIKKMLGYSYESETAELESIASSDDPNITYTCEVKTVDDGETITKTIVVCHDQDGTVVDGKEGTVISSERVNRTNILYDGYNNLVKNMSFQYAFRTLMVLYFAFAGIGVTMGIINISQGEAGKRIIRIGLILFFISPDSWGVYNKYIVTFFQEVPTYLNSLMVTMIEPDVDTENVFGVTDKMLRIIFSEAFHAKIGGLLFAPIWYGIFYVPLIYYTLFVYINSVAKAIMMYLVSLFMVTLLLVIGPLFFAFALFDRTKEFFDNWLKLMLSFAMQQFMLFAVIGFFTWLIYIFITGLFNYGVCWQPVWVFTDVPVLSLNFWLIDGFDMAYEDPASGNVHMNSQNYPNFFGIIALFIVADSMRRFIGFIVGVADSLAGGAGVNIKDLAKDVNDLGKGLRKAASDMVEKPIERKWTEKKRAFDRKYLGYLPKEQRKAQQLNKMKLRQAINHSAQESKTIMKDDGKGGLRALNDAERKDFIKQATAAKASELGLNPNAVTSSKSFDKRAGNQMKYSAKDARLEKDIKQKYGEQGEQASKAFMDNLGEKLSERANKDDNRRDYNARNLKTTGISGSEKMGSVKDADMNKFKQDIDNSKKTGLQDKIRNKISGSNKMLEEDVNKIAEGMQKKYNSSKSYRAKIQDQQSKESDVTTKSMNSYDYMRKLAVEESKKNKDQNDIKRNAIKDKYKEHIDADQILRRKMNKYYKHADDKNPSKYMEKKEEQRQKYNKENNANLEMPDFLRKQAEMEANRNKIIAAKKSGDSSLVDKDAFAQYLADKENAKNEWHNAKETAKAPFEGARAGAENLRSGYKRLRGNVPFADKSKQTNIKQLKAVSDKALKKDGTYDAIDKKVNDEWKNKSKLEKAKNFVPFAQGKRQEAKKLKKKERIKWRADKGRITDKLRQDGTYDEIEKKLHTKTHSVGTKMGALQNETFGKAMERKKMREQAKKEFADRLENEVMVTNANAEATLDKHARDVPNVNLSNSNDVPMVQNSDDTSSKNNELDQHAETDNGNETPIVEPVIEKASDSESVKNQPEKEDKDRDSKDKKEEPSVKKEADVKLTDKAQTKPNNDNKDKEKEKEEKEKNKKSNIEAITTKIKELERKYNASSDENEKATLKGDIEAEKARLKSQQ